MLAIHISKDTLRYAQLVNFKGTPFIESLGKMDLGDLLQVPDTSNAEVTRALAEKIAEIRDSAEFPDNSTHLVIDSSWFPTLIHNVDEELTASDREKFLDWRFRELLDTSSENYRIVHQALTSQGAVDQKFLSIGIPNSFSSWVDKISRPSELDVQNVILDIQSLGDLLSTTHLLEGDDNLQVILDNRSEGFTCWLFKSSDYVGHLHAVMDLEGKLSVDLMRGDPDLVKRVARAVELALNGDQNPDTALAHIFYFSSTGSASTLTNLQNYPESCQPLKLVERINFRDPEFPNIDEYAVVVGALSDEIRTGLSED